MADFKVDFIFQDKNRDRPVGWSESLYLSAYADHAEALVAAYGLANRRVAMLGGGVVLKNIRVSDMAILGDSQVFPGVNPNPQGIYNPALAALGAPDFTRADFPWSALECRIDATALYRRAYFLSGNSDGLQLDNEGKVEEPVWINAFLAWVTVLTNPANRWSFRVRDKTGGAVPFKPVLDFDDATKIFNVPAHGFVVGDIVSFKRGGFDPRITGQWRVSVVPDVNHFVLQGFILDTHINGSPVVQKIMKVYKQITAVVQQYYGFKKRGGISGAVRGRR
jgi:hypothetical protein